ncbi:MAG: DUF1735 domain-containing protein [Bacteroidetes bacterium]|nr:DUF1735 domain-containing protein [Bacteroidota bacterium]MBS1649302.1 DUF1735 domain-containing protein [Bacteroidota bacterium]
MNYKITRLMTLSGILIAMMNFTSCLKDATAPNLSPAAGTSATVGIRIDNSDGAVDGVGGGYSQSGKFNVFNRTVKFFPSPDTAKINVTVSYLGPDVAPQDIQVTLAVDAANLTAFNATGAFSGNWGFNVTQPNATDVWSIPTTVTIPKGQKEATVQVKLKNSLTLGQPYAMPIKISATSYGTVSTNQASVIYLFQRVNNYDGVYMVNGKLTDALGTYTGKYPKYVELMTYDANTVVMLDQNYGNFYYIMVNLATGGAANLSGIGFGFDASGNCTNVYSVAGGAPASPTFGTLATGATNKFTPQVNSYSPTPAFLINFTAVAARFNINDKFTYVSDRNDAN